MKSYESIGCLAESADSQTNHINNLQVNLESEHYRLVVFASVRYDKVAELSAVESSSASALSFRSELFLIV